MKIMNFTQTMLTTVVLVMGTGLAAGGAPPQNGRLRGEAAIQALGANLPAVAARHHVSAARLRQALRKEHDLWVDGASRLLYSCEGLAAPAAVSGADAGDEVAVVSPYPLDQTFQLHSLPGSTKVIYLDFDGHVVSGTSWNGYNGGADIDCQPYSFDGDGTSNFTDNEKARIQYIWQRVAEDFAPFTADVTTEDPGVDALRKSGSGDQAYGIRVLITPTQDWYGSAGGVAYIGSFTWGSDTPCFVFESSLGNGNEKYTAEAASHEVGHTVGLYHDGNSSTSYYSGHGSGATGWAPIMGVGYYKQLSQWSKGEYTDANNQEDDLQKMQNYGISYRGDDHGNSDGAATSIPIGSTIDVDGLIERNTDVDVFEFTTKPGTISLFVDPGPRGPNLDILAELYDSGGGLVTSSNPADGIAASISLDVVAGTYYLRVQGTGKGDPLTAYSDYASLGHYRFHGTIIDPTGEIPPVATIVATPTSGDVPLAVQFDSSQSQDPDGTIVSYSWDFGDGNSSTDPNPANTYGAVGTYTAVLTVTDDSDLTDTDSVVIEVLPPNALPTAVIGPVPESAYAPATIVFDGAGSSDPDGALVSYVWDFGDGSTGSGATVTHTYGDLGTFTATLTVTDSRGATDTDQAVIVVEQDPAKVIFVRAIRMSLVSVPGGRAAEARVTVINLAGDPVSGVTVSGAWSGLVNGSGTGTTGSDGSVTFQSRKNKKQGTFTFTVTNLAKSAHVYDPSLNAIASASISTNAPPNQNPVADIQADPSSGPPPLPVTFSGSGSSDPDGTVVWYTWDFGDGGSASGVTASHTYAVAGTYTATLTVEDDQGATDTATVTVTVTGPPPNQEPVAVIDADPTSGFMPLAVSFSGASSYDSDGTIVSYSWDFGDGGSGSGVTASHTYTAAGDYTATLTVEDDEGATDTASVTVSVTDPSVNQEPVAVIVADPTSGVLPLAVSFSGSGSYDPDGTIASYSWDFGDGGSASGVTASHTYAAAGSYTAMLTVEDNEGATGSTAVTITVDAPPPNQDPVAVIAANPTSGVAPLAVNFSGSGSSDSDGTIVSYSWDFGDGGSASGVTVSHTYTAAGSYTATLTVEDDEGATGSDTVAITVHSDQQAVYVGDIDIWLRAIAKSTRAECTVLILDQDDNPCASASVTVSWSGVIGGTSSGVTGTDGTVALRSAKTKTHGTFTVTVTGVSKSGYLYDSSRNVVTSASVSNTPSP